MRATIARARGLEAGCKSAEPFHPVVLDDFTNRHRAAGPATSDHLDTVGVPGEDRCGTAVGPPGFGRVPHIVFGWPLRPTPQFPNLDLHGQISGWPDVWPAFGEQQIDFGRPASDPFYGDQLRDRFLVLFGKRRQIQRSGNDAFGEAARIAAFDG